MPQTPPVPVAQQFALARQKMQQEMPNEASAVSVEPMGTFGQALSGLKGRIIGVGTPGAMTNPFTGNVSYDPNAMQGQSQDTVDQTLAHELTHSRQVLQKPWYQRGLEMLKGALPGANKWDYPVPPGVTAPANYQPDPVELEAYQAENDRSLAKGISPDGDVYLPAPVRKQTATAPIAGLKSYGQGQ